jgi:hypothetical protein
MPLPERFFTPAGRNQRSGGGDSLLSSQQYDAADCGDLTVEYGIYRKSDKFFETESDTD